MKMKKMLALAMTVVMTAVFAGCGATAEKPLKEVKSEDETVSIMLEEDWEQETQDMEGMEGSILASRNNGREAVLLIQYAKGIFAVESIDDVKELVVTGNQVSNESPVSGIEMPGLTGVEAYTCDMVADGVEVEACAVYGESAYAYYSFMYLGNRVNDKKMEDVKEMCASFKETVPESALPTETTDTVLWINGTHALLTALNGWDYTMYGGMAVNDTSMAL